MDSLNTEAKLTLVTFILELCLNGGVELYSPLGSSV